MPRYALALLITFTAAALNGCAPLVVGGAAATGVVVAEDRRTVGTITEDQAIELKTANRIGDRVKNAHVNVTSYNRMVLLTGEVPDAAAKAVAEKTANAVENVRGVFREQDRLILNGIAYHESVAEGTLVLTSGLGGVYPRGIPIGHVDAIAETQGEWLRSYWLRPAVEPGSVTHVLVKSAEAPEDLLDLWAADSVNVGGEGDPGGASPPPPGVGLSGSPQGPVR